MMSSHESVGVRGTERRGRLETPYVQPEGLGRKTPQVIGSPIVEPGRFTWTIFRRRLRSSWAIPSADPRLSDLF